ncbi:MAG: pitrilysin family protein [Chloroflexi bacterium]|nr:pitrilysin family protein [Chloroflexota bacterium]
MIPLDFEKFTLPNGLQVVLHEDHSLPLVAVNLWYHVGSKDEQPGRTGFAHLFEHIMFEGSKHHNKSFFDPLQKVGANLNGSTTPDRTNYWVTLPSEYLELALWLESDRMGFLLDALDQKRFDVQRDVVKNERRQNYENRPYGMAHLLMQPVLFPTPHPYNWPTIGTPEDLDAAQLDDVKDFFRRHYTPNNASLAIVGDIDPSDVRLQVERYFGAIPPASAVTRVGRMDTRLQSDVQLHMQDNVQLSRLYLAWPGLPAFDKDRPAKDVLGAILGDGKTSRLYQLLVYDKQVARDVSVATGAMEIAGEFEISVTAAQGQNLGDLQAIVDEELTKIQAKAPTEEEISRARTRVETHYVGMLERFGGFGGRADQFNYFNVYKGDPGLVSTIMDRYRTVSEKDVQRVAKSLFMEHRVRLDVTPRAALRASSHEIDRTVMPTASKTSSFEPPIPSRRTLSNGMELMHLERPGLPLVSFGLVLKSGAAADPEPQPGLTHFTASMLQEGTASRSSQDISTALENLGSQLDIEVSREYVMLAMDMLSSNWTAALELLGDIVINPSFPSKELERIKKERLTDLKRISDDPTMIAARSSRALLYGANHPYGHPVSGNERSVRAFKRDDLVKHAKKTLVSDMATLIVVGPVSLDDAVKQAETVFSSLKRGGKATKSIEVKVEPLPEKTTMYLADKRGAAQSVIYAGHITIPRHHPDYFAMNLLNLVLGGQFSARLNMNLRQDKGYSYGYMSGIDWVKGPSAFLAGGAVQTQVTKEAVIESLAELRDIREKRPVTSEEFENARQGVFRGFASAFETQSQLLHQLARIVAFELPETYFQDYLNDMKKVTLKDVRRVAREHFEGSPIVLLVVGDMGEIEAGLHELELDTAMVDYEGRILK